MTRKRDNFQQGKKSETPVRQQPQKKRHASQVTQDGGNPSKAQSGRKEKKK